MRENKLRKKMQRGELAFGTYVSLADPALVEIIGLAGFDVAFIDMEHGGFDLLMVENMVRACDVVGITSMVRVSDNNPKTILRLLDMGVQALKVPHIESAEDARNMVRAVRYSPMGDRSIGGATRATRYGTIERYEHMKNSNEDIVLCVIVEDMGAVSQIEEIAAIEGLDLIAVGPGDLSQAMGVTDKNDPRLKETIYGIADTLKRVGGAKLSFSVLNPAFPLDAGELSSMGVAYSNVAPSDVDRLMQSYKEQIKHMQAQLGK